MSVKYSDIKADGQAPMDELITVNETINFNMRSTRKCQRHAPAARHGSAPTFAPERAIPDPHRPGCPYGGVGCQPK